MTRRSEIINTLIRACNAVRYYGLNPKHEIRSSKQILSSNDQNLKIMFRNWNFEFKYCLGFRY